MNEKTIQKYEDAMKRHTGHDIEIRHSYTGKKMFVSCRDMTDGVCLWSVPGDAPSMAAAYGNWCEEKEVEKF
jgi:hypothetical protein